MTFTADNQQQTKKVLAQIIAKTWLNEEFKQNLIANPAKVLEGNGLNVPSGVEFKREGNTLLGTSSGEVFYELTLSDKPAEVTDQAIQSWANSETEFIGSNCEDGTCFIST